MRQARPEGNAANIPLDPAPGAAPIRERSASSEVSRELFRPIPEPFRSRPTAWRLRQGAAALRAARPGRPDPQRGGMAGLWSRRDGARRRDRGLARARLQPRPGGPRAGGRRRRVWSPPWPQHQAMLEARLRELAGMVEKLRGLRRDLAQGRAPTVAELARLAAPAAACSVAFDLPWPWGGERFELRDIKPLTYIIGPLGSGKTRLAQRLAETLPDAAFLGLERLGGWCRGGAGAAGRRPGAQIAGRPDPGLAPRGRRHRIRRPDRLARRAGIRRPGHPRRRHDRAGAGPRHPGGRDRPSPPPRARRAAALPAHALLRDPGSGGRDRRRGDHPLPRQSQPADPASPPTPAPPATRPSRPAWPRPRCGRGRKGSSRGGRSGETAKG